MSELQGFESSNAERRLPAAPKLPRKAAKGEKNPPEVKAGRTWRDYVLWIVIAVLAVGAAAEFRAQASYRKTLAACNGALEGQEGKADPKHVTFDQLKEKLPPNPVYTQEVHSFAKAGMYTWTWQGVRRYKVHLFVNPKDGSVWDVTSEP